MSAPQVPSFATLGLSDAVLRAVFDVGYETPSPIQAAAIGPVLEGRDVLGRGRAGEQEQGAADAEGRVPRPRSRRASPGAHRFMRTASSPTASMAVGLGGPR